MISIYDYLTESGLPEEMKTTERMAFCHAFDQQKKKFLERLERVYIWADITKVSDDKLDILAVENRVLFYDSEMLADVKRDMIRNAVCWHMKLGTNHAMKDIIDILFENKNTLIEQWYEYGGVPYHFRIVLDISEPRIKLDILKIINMILTYKRLTSRLDVVVYSYKPKTQVYTRSFGKINSSLRIPAYVPKVIDAKTIIYPTQVLYRTDFITVKNK